MCVDDDPKPLHMTPGWWSLSDNDQITIMEKWRVFRDSLEEKKSPEQRIRELEAEMNFVLGNASTTTREFLKKTKTTRKEFKILVENYKQIQLSKLTRYRLGIFR